ncbi:MAG: hypothetical protein M3Q30_09840 [Actinomycetota bacterium]|nr:hypothetical protein [Actinomycetota bacterium]
MRHALTIITNIRDQIVETLERLGEARKRRDVVRAAGETFPGALRSAGTGSLATALVNARVDDADSVLVLDRRSYPTLGPDGDGDLPTEIVGAVQAHIGPRVRKTYAKAEACEMKRGLIVRCHENFDGVDPTVDFVIALTRAKGPGLWIPNMDAGCWDPSHPELHVELFNSGSRELRRSRAQATRIVKAWNKQHAEPALSSFNVSALGLEAITIPLALDEAVAVLFEHAASSLALRRTEDPAGVSGLVKLVKSKEITINRLTDAATKVRQAVESTDEDEVTELLAGVFWKYVTAPTGGTAALLGGLRSGNGGVGTASGLLLTGAGARLKPTRSFGGHRA